MSTHVCLAGAWVLRTRGSDHVPGIEGVTAAPISAKIRGLHKSERFIITQRAAGLIEEIQLMLRGQNVKGYMSNSYQIGKLNYEKKNLCAVITCVDKEFRELCIQRMGPAKGQRSLERYTLDNNKREIKVEIDIDSSDSGRVKMVKYLVRSADSADVKVPPLIKFRTTNATNNWQNEESHCIELIGETSVDIQGSVVRCINTRNGHSVNIEDDSQTTSPATKAPETRRYFDGKFIQDEKVTYFVVRVMLGGSYWDIVRRYKEFDALRNFVETQAGSSFSFEPFPGKTLFKSKGKSFENRKFCLNKYIESILRSECVSMSNIRDSVCSFLEIPEHLSKITESRIGTGGQAISRAISGGSGGSGPSNASETSVLTASTLRNGIQETAYTYPQDALFSRLSQGIVVIKHGRQGRPHARVLRCNDAVTRIYWSDPKIIHQGSLPPEDKSLRLREVLDVRRGTDPDPNARGKVGTSILRKNCTKETLPLTFSLILSSRSFDIQCMNETEFNFLYGNFSAYCSRFTNRMNRDYDEGSIITDSQA